MRLTDKNNDKFYILLTTEKRGGDFMSTKVTGFGKKYLRLEGYDIKEITTLLKAYGDAYDLNVDEKIKEIQLDNILNKRKVLVVIEKGGENYYPVRINLNDSFNFKFMILWLVNIIAWLFFILVLKKTLKLIIIGMLLLTIRNFSLYGAVYIFFNPILLINAVLLYLILPSDVYKEIKPYSLSCSLKEIEKLRNFREVIEKLKFNIKVQGFRGFIKNMFLIIDSQARTFFLRYKSRNNIVFFNECNYIKKKKILIRHLKND